MPSSSAQKKTNVVVFRSKTKTIAHRSFTVHGGRITESPRKVTRVLYASLERVLVLEAVVMVAMPLVVLSVVAVRDHACVMLVVPVFVTVFVTVFVATVKVAVRDHSGVMLVVPVVFVLPVFEMACSVLMTTLFVTTVFMAMFVSVFVAVFVTAVIVTAVIATATAVAYAEELALVFVVRLVMVMVIVMFALATVAIVAIVTANLELVTLVFDGAGWMVLVSAVRLWVERVVAVVFGSPVAMAVVVVWEMALVLVVVVPASPTVTGAKEAAASKRPIAFFHLHEPSESAFVCIESREARTKKGREHLRHGPTLVSG
jgi:hypothetical protein